MTIGSVSGTRTTVCLPAISCTHDSQTRPALKDHRWRFGAAKEAEILSLFEDDSLAFNADVELVAFVDCKYLTYLRWQDDTTKLVDLSHYTGRLQIPPPDWVSTKNVMARESRSQIS